MNGKTFVLATNNAGKLREMKPLFASLGMDCLSMKEAGIRSDPEETGTTFDENALIKAKSAMQASGLPSVADDSGLEVEALNGAPGVLSARYSGNHDDGDSERCEFLLSKMRGVEQRRARFVSSIVCCFPNGDVLMAKGECPGTIAQEQIGSNGFGYDCLFIPDGYEKTFGELSQDVKNLISHRAKAVAEFKKKLHNYYVDWER